MLQSTIHNKFKSTRTYLVLLQETTSKEILFAVLVVQVQEDVKTQEVTIVAPHWIHEQISVVDVMSKTGQSQVNISIAMIAYLKTNVLMPTAGSLTIFQAHFNVLMQIIQLNFAPENSNISDSTNSNNL